MNKTGFKNEIQKELNCDEEYVLKIMDVLDDYTLFGKKNKVKTTTALMNKLNVDENEAEHIYETCSGIAAHAIKEKLKHPFRSQD